MLKKMFLLFSIITLAIFTGNLKSSDNDKKLTLSATKLERVIKGDKQRQQAKFNNLPPQLQTLIKNTFTLDSYRILENKTGEIVAANKAQNLKASFSQEKTQIVGTRSNNAWELNLNLTGFGWQDEIKAVEPGVLSYEKNRVEIKRLSLTEWFVNDTRGLEQGFTIDSPPAGQGTQLVLQLSVSSNLQSQISENKKDINLTNKTGQSIDYSGLIAKDANGKELKTWFESKETSTGTTWQIFVDVKNAQFPILVDPVINEDNKIVPADIAPIDRFGTAVDISGDTVIAGSPSTGTIFTGNVPGTAYIFVRNPDGTWTEQARLVASNGVDGDQFGESVAIDGDTAVIGARFTGSAYVFTRNGTVWTEQQILNGSNSGTFGSSVDISGDTIAVLSEGDALPANQGFIDGAAFIFVRDATGFWAQQAKLKTLPTPGVNAEGELFTLALSGDTVVIGNIFESPNGAARVFVRTGTTWSEQANLTPNDGSGLLGLPGSARFGFSVDISGDTAIIGAPDDDNDGEPFGAAYIFVRNAKGVWTQQAKLLPSDGEDDDEFGFSVAISGETVVVGARLKVNITGTNRGAAYTFERTGTTWTQQLKLFGGFDNFEISIGSFGSAVAISGNTAFIGSPGDDLLGVSSGGAGYIFNLFCQDDLGFQGPGDLTLCVCGEDLTQDDSNATVTVTGAPPSSSIFVVLGLNNTPASFASGTIVPSQDVILGPFTTDSFGVFKFPLGGGANTPITLFLQAGGFDGPVFEISNAVEVKIGF